ncbi:hypothetical protein HCU40_16625 [Pseudanabaena biceps]|nr:hypothetical protein [Pseudanabaena biceps]
MNEELLMSLIEKVKKLVELLYDQEFAVEHINIENDKIVFNVDIDDRPKTFTFTMNGDLVSLTDWEK